MVSFAAILFAAAAALSRPGLAFQPPISAGTAPRAPATIMASSSTAAAPTSEGASKSHLYDPVERDARYGRGNVAQYLLDLDAEGATFDFCGGERDALLHLL